MSAYVLPIHLGTAACANLLLGAVIWAMALKNSDLVPIVGIIL